MVITFKFQCIKCRPNLIGNKFIIKLKTVVKDLFLGLNLRNNKCSSEYTAISVTEVETNSVIRL